MTGVGIVRKVGVDQEKRRVGLAQGSRDTEAAHGQNELTPTTGKGSAGPPKNADPAEKGGGQGHRPTTTPTRQYYQIRMSWEKEKLHHAGERGIFRRKGGGAGKDKGAEATKG